MAIAQEIADAAWEAVRPQDQIDLAQHALSVSADCADAYVILANQAASRQKSQQLLEQAVAAGARAIGPENFDIAAGHFWLDQRTRPYMRARLGLAQCLWESGKRTEAADHYADMLRLNPNDNQGIRYLLLSALVDLDRDDDALALLQRYADDSSAEWAYTNALLAFRREGDSDASRDRLLAAVEVNQFVPQFLLGNKNLPPIPPSYMSPGGEDEAVGYAAQFLRTWRSSPGAIPWLRKTLKVPLPQAPKPRKPVWSLFRHTFLRLPRIADEVWQLDVCRLPQPPAEDIEDSPRKRAHFTQMPWALVLWNRNLDVVLAFDAGDRKPSLAEAWESLVEALLRPRIGEAHRPGEIHVRRKTFFTVWKEKLREVNIVCRLRNKMDKLDRVLENLAPAGRDTRPPLESAAPTDAVDLDELAALPQSLGETWQADVRRLPGWLEQEGELRRPWTSLVTGRLFAESEENAVLTQNLTLDPPSAEWLWKNIADAMLRPVMGQAHRPGIIEVADESCRQELRDRLDSIGVRCVAADLQQIDDVFHQLGKYLSGGKAARPLVEVPGVRLEDVRGFYAAAAEFYRAAPWRLVPGDTMLKVECSKFNTNTWYGVVMGQSGLVLGLALYEDLNMLQSLFSAATVTAAQPGPARGSQPNDEQMSRQVSGLSVMFGEPFEVPIPDLDAALRYGWEVAGNEAYPNPIHVNPGRSMRPPLAWELELLEGSLRAIPLYLQSGQPVGEFTVSCARGDLTLRVSQM